MLTKGRCLNHAGDAEGLPQQSSMQGSSLVSSDAEHVSKPTQSVHSEPLYPPGTRPFDATHNPAVGMCVGLSPAGLCKPADYDWNGDPLAPGIHSTVVRVVRDKGGDWVYIRSDDGSCTIRPTQHSVLLFSFVTDLVTGRYLRFL